MMIPSNNFAHFIDIASNLTTLQSCHLNRRHSTGCNSFVEMLCHHLVEELVLNNPYHSHQTARKENVAEVAQMNTLPVDFHPQCLFGTFEVAADTLSQAAHQQVLAVAERQGAAQEAEDHTQTLAELVLVAQVEGLVAQAHTLMQAELALEVVGLGY
jgi:hypothetical protein